MVMNLSIPIAFGAGMVSFLSPCVLPLVPVYLSYITGFSVDALNKGEASVGKVITETLFFVMGFSLVFVAFGASASAIGGWLNAHAHIIVRVLGAFVVVMGISLCGVFKPAFMQRVYQMPMPKTKGRLVGSLLLGVVFAFGWCPCVGPILAGILAYASTQAGAQKGVALLAAYSAGLAVPFFATALIFNRAVVMIRGFQRYTKAVQTISGLVLIALGVVMVAGRFGV